ncbi:hypothetical protein SRHO_G00075810 [Serrasalmus rhombeus]
MYGTPGATGIAWSTFAHFVGRPSSSVPLRRTLQGVPKDYWDLKEVFSKEKAQLEKSVFHFSTIAFLGFVVSTDTFWMDPAKIRALVDWPYPTSLRLVRR